MENTSNIPDSIKIYLDEISNRLSSGKAAIMVGAGFSKNAEKNDENSRVFPSWQELGDEFQKLSNYRNEENQKYLNVLKLAEEVEATIGRPRLEEELINLIPDVGHAPSELHERLLKLPWVDIFTTNYDTLLERTADKIDKPIYHTVQRKEHLINAKKPRIIKLHGSFNSTPLIITQEDYRTYPQEYAPFVNTVQQSFLENTICLIGFSGDDPNFLEWMGWIRDILEKYAKKKVYLIGVFNFTETEKNLIEKREITIVDMSLYPDVGAHDYEKGVEKFLEYLEKKYKKHLKNNALEFELLDKTSENRKLTPQFRSSADWKSSSVDRNWGDNLKYRPPSDASNEIEDIKEVTSAWKGMREKYPGWLILPEYKRRKLWFDTEDWVHYILKKNIPDTIILEPIAIKFLYELNWRMEKCLFPLLGTIAELINSTVQENIENKDAEIVNMRIYLLQSLMRYYRENWMFEEWGDVEKTIKKDIKYLNPEQKADYHYECCLAALFQLDMVRFREKLNNWKRNDSLPFSEARRAILLTEIGKIDKAKEILERSIKNIRVEMSSSFNLDDIPLASQEAYTILLLKYVKQASSPISNPHKIHEEFDERIKYLKQYECDVVDEITFFSNSLKHKFQPKKIQTSKWKFDIGKSTRSVSLDPNDPEVLLAFNFLRFFECTGMPFKIKDMPNMQDTVTNSLQRILSYSEFWAISIISRTKNSKAVDDFMNRENLSSLSQDIIQNAINIFINFLEGWIKQNQEQSNDQQDFAECISEFLSRLCLRTSYKYKVKILNLLLKIYKNEKQSYNKLAENMTKNVVNSFSHSELMSLIEKIVNFPISKIGDNMNSNFIHPIHFIDDRKDFSVKIKNRAKFDKRIDYFFRNADEDDIKLRAPSISILGSLYSYGLLKTDQKEKFIKLLWSKLDDYGLPQDTYYYKFAFLDLLKPKGMNISQRFKKYVLAEAFPIKKDNKSFNPNEKKIVICHEILNSAENINWKENEVLLLYFKALEWWNIEKEFIIEEEPYDIFDMAGYFKNRVNQIFQVLTNFILPNMDEHIAGDIKQVFLNMLKEANDKNLPTLKLECSAMHLFPKRRQKIFDNLENNLASRNKSIFIDSLLGVIALAKQKNIYKGFEKQQQYFVNLLGQTIRWQNHVDLYNSLNVCERIILETPDLVSKDFQKSILIGLKNTDISTSEKESARPYEENLEIRVKGAELAHVIFKFYQEKEAAIPPEVILWQEICKSEEEYAEVRNAWID